MPKFNSHLETTAFLFPFKKVGLSNYSPLSGSSHRMVEPSLYFLGKSQQVQSGMDTYLEKSTAPGIE